MNDNLTTVTAPDGDPKITLGLLNAVEQNSALTQRSVASELGIALGLANAYLKRCIRKGLIKVTQAPTNRYAYYLTPTGFAEKSRLTAQYLSVSFNFFRRARGQCADILATCERRNWRRIALAGASDLSEIATLCSCDLDVEIIGVVDPTLNAPRFAGVPVVARLKELGAVSAVIVTDLRTPQATYDTLAETLPLERLLTPRLLGISRERSKLAE